MRKLLLLTLLLTIPATLFAPPPEKEELKLSEIDGCIQKQDVEAIREKLYDSLLKMFTLYEAADPHEWRSPSGDYAKVLDLRRENYDMDLKLFKINKDVIKDANFYKLSDVHRFRIAYESLNYYCDSIASGYRLGFKNGPTYEAVKKAYDILDESRGVREKVDRHFQILIYWYERKYGQPTY